MSDVLTKEQIETLEEQALDGAFPGDGQYLAAAARTALHYMKDATEFAEELHAVEVTNIKLQEALRLADMNVDYVMREEDWHMGAESIKTLNEIVNAIANLKEKGLL